jgi:dimethylhistidine N-methyltransferase
MNELNEVLTGLKKRKKNLSPKFLYDEKGSELFESITKTKAYYPTSAETEILKDHSAEMAWMIGPYATIIEPGCGNCEKIRYLLRKLPRPRAYIASDISAEILHRRTDDLQEEFPTIPILPIVEDFNERITIPFDNMPSQGKRVVFFPGSTIGNLAPAEAQKLLKRFARSVRKGGGLLIGVDLKKDPKILHRAYNDPEGITAQFNLNLLNRLNRDFDASFDLRQFEHKSFYNPRRSRVEMHLVSRAPQTVTIANKKIRFGRNESIHTENSYKYTVAEFKKLAAGAGFTLKQSWQDTRNFFCVYYFER